QHLRAILDLPLGNTESKVGGIMVNLVGAEGHTGEVVYQNIHKIMALKGVTPHIYGKKITRPFRKMGQDRKSTRLNSSHVSSSYAIHTRSLHDALPISTSSSDPGSSTR